MLAINLITYNSDFQKKSNLHSTHLDLIAGLTKEITINIVDRKGIDKIKNSDLKIIFLATGGVEHLVAEDYEKLPHPLIIMADGLENSLASAMEIMFWLRGKNAKYELLQGNPHQIVERLYYLDKMFRSRNELTGKRIGVIGSPSPWLIASNADYLLSQRRWGVNFVDVPSTEIAERAAHIKDEESAKIAAEITSKALAIRDVRATDILKSCKFYLALKQTVKEYDLDAFTLSCFDTAKVSGTTGCLAVSLLNDEGIIAGCEGDMQSVFTLLLAKAVTGETGFMGNILFINQPNNDVVIGHNTIGLKQVNQFIIRTHVESGKGVTIQGILPETEITMLKCGNESLDNYFVSEGRIEENTNYVNACRTQIRIHLSNSVDYFINNPIGNHHIIIPGNYEKILSDFLSANSCKQII